jgi:hypothetical protein
MVATVGREKVEEWLAEPLVTPAGRTRPQRSDAERAAIREMLSGFGGPPS